MTEDKTTMDFYGIALDKAKRMLNSIDDEYCCKNFGKADLLNIIGRLFPDLENHPERIRLSIIGRLKEADATDEELEYMRSLKHVYDHIVVTQNDLDAFNRMRNNDTLSSEDVERLEDLYQALKRIAIV